LTAVRDCLLNTVANTTAAGRLVHPRTRYAAVTGSHMVTRTHTHTHGCISRKFVIYISTY